CVTDITGSVKPGRIIGALAGLVGLGGAAAWWQLFRRPLPQTAGTLHMHGLDAPVEIRRDRWGVPHIYAASPRDLWFAQGFCFGQDRLCSSTSTAASPMAGSPRSRGRPRCPATG